MADNHRLGRLAHSFAAHAVIALVLTAWVGTAGAAAGADRGEFSSFATELLDRLGDGKISGKRIALWPFLRGEDIPVTIEVARHYNRSLLSALSGLGRGFRFVSDELVAGVIRRLEESGEGVGNPVADVATAGIADILLIGRLDMVEGKVVLSYRAVGVAGAQAGFDLAVAGPHPVVAETGKREVTVLQAARNAARHIADRAADLVELRLGGIRFQSSRVHTPFGRYMEAQIADAVTNQFSSKLTERAIRVLPAQLEEARVRGMRGKRMTSKSMRPESAAGESGVYVLTGNYWVVGEAVDLRLALRDGGGRTVAWNGLVRPPVGVALRPPGRMPAHLIDNDGFGPIRFLLTSDRGDSPAYTVGDKLLMLIQTDRDAWLYCFYRQSDGGWLRIFPNTYFGKARIEGGRLHTIPGEDFPFDLVFAEPAGVDLVKCFAAGEDLAGRLPEALRETSSAPLPPGMDSRLPTAFRNLDGVALTEMSLVITVER